MSNKLLYIGSVRMIKPKFFNFETDEDFKRTSPPRLEKQVPKSRKIPKFQFKVSKDKLIIIGLIALFIFAVALTWKYGGTESNMWFNRGRF